ncbi:MAG: ArsA family ATPase [Deltaproteobacteria bacterium]
MRTLLAGELPFASRRLQICVGAGGVGKTTLAAAIALRAAVAGRKAVVCTIDPARRLADSLGLGELGNEERRVSPERLEAAGLRPKGELWAMMLDLGRSWDELIARHAPSPEQRERIYANRFYQQLSNALAGSQEYIAVEKLYELAQSRDYDLIVLDTPPTAHALDFLDAPNRVVDFLDNEAARWLLTPALAAGKMGLGLFGRGGGRLFRGISELTGADTLRELAEFMLSLSGMYEGFKDRAARVKKLLAGPDSGFVLVTTPQPLTVGEALQLHAALGKGGLHVGAVVANRVHSPVQAPPRGELAAAGRRAGLPRELTERIGQALDDARSLWAGDEEQLARLRRAGIEPRVLPRHERDVHDIAALWALTEPLSRP